MPDFALPFNILAFLFAMAGIIVLLTKTMPQKRDKYFLIFAGLVLTAIAGVNTLTHAHIIASYNILEDFFITILFPLTIILIYSFLVRKELNRRTHLEQEFRETSERLSKMFSAIPIMLIMTDRSTSTLTVNAETERRLGYNTAELQRNDLVSTFIYSQNDHERARKASRNFSGTWSEFTIKTKSGQIRKQRWTRIALDENLSIGIGVDLEEQRQIEKELALEQSRFKLISKATNDVMYDWNLEDDSVWWNQGWQTHFGFTEDQIGQNFSWLKSLIHPDDLVELNEKFERLKNSKLNSWRHNYRLIRPNGSILYVSDRGYFVRDKHGNATGLLGALVNNSEQKEVERLLRESEQKYRLFFDQSPLGKCIYDPDSLEIIEINKAALILYKYERDEIIGQSILDLFIDEQREQAVNEILHYRGISSPTIEWMHQTKHKDPIMVEVSGTQIAYLGKEHRLAIITDITQQRLTEEQLFSSFIDGENKERERLAQELHDGLGQYLAASNMHLEGLKKSLQHASEKEQMLYKKGLSFLQQAMVETRSISHNLMPRIISEQGLAEAIQTLTKSFHQPGHLQITYYHNLHELELSDKLEVNIYRIVQECLSNVVKHAKATVVNVQLIKDENDLILTIEDNGKGFETGAGTASLGLGLNGIKTRTFALGGIVDVDTKKNKGTLITVCVPINRARRMYEKNKNSDR